MIVASVIQRHADEAAALHEQRCDRTRAPRMSLDGLHDFDSRLSAHLEGLSIAGEDAWPFCEASLESPSAGAVFTAAIRTIEQRRLDRLDRLFALVGALPETRRGLIAAFGWMDRSSLTGTVAAALGSEDPLKRVVGLAACGTQRVSPGSAINRYLEDSNPEVRSRALRTAGEAGLREAVRSCARNAGSDVLECRFWAAWSAVLLGDRREALDVLTDVALTPGSLRWRALQLVLQTTGPGKAHSVLQAIAQRSEPRRWLVRGSGVAGDPAYVAWLVDQMSNPAHARPAGEAFSLITGANLSESGLEAAAPANFEWGPNDDPDDPDVETDPDEGLPWPDVPAIEAWWSAHSDHFRTGSRYFMGAPVTRRHCLQVLTSGCQRQRLLAAQHLCLLEPGTPLFNTCAPAWRQRRLLAEMK